MYQCAYKVSDRNIHDPGDVDEASIDGTGRKSENNANVIRSPAAYSHYVISTESLLDLRSLDLCTFPQPHSTLLVYSVLHLTNISGFSTKTPTQAPDCCWWFFSSSLFLSLVVLNWLSSSFCCAAQYLFSVSVVLILLLFRTDCPLRFSLLFWLQLAHTPKNSMTMHKKRKNRRMKKISN